MTTNNTSSILKDVVAYVDVWSSDKTANYSKPFVQQLQEMGAQVSKTFNKQVTHVVFNNGHPATWRKARKSNVRLVSVLWVGRCFDDGVRVDEKLYPAVDETNPVLKNKKHRCMQPKDSPERTPENDKRMKKKLDKMMKDLMPKQLLDTDVSPIIIDEENGIVYSPAFKRSDYMAQRLKDMKEKHENLSPTASQMIESGSPAGLKPSLGSTPTVLKLIYDQSDDDSSASVAEPAYSPDKEEERTLHNVIDHSHLKQRQRKSSENPYPSPCHDVTKRIPTPLKCMDFIDKEDEDMITSKKFRRTPVRKKTAEKHKSTDLQESPSQGRSDNSKRSQIKSCSPSPDRAAKGKGKCMAAKSFTKKMAQLSPNAVNSPSCLSSPSELDEAVVKQSKEPSTLIKKVEPKTPGRAKPSLSSKVQSCSPSGDNRCVESESTKDDDVFKDLFSPVNRRQKIKQPPLPNLPVEKDIQIPFELGSVPKKRKQRRSESLDTSSHLKQCYRKSSENPSLSPCRDVQKRVSTPLKCPDFINEEDKDGKTPRHSRKTSGREKLAEKHKSLDLQNSPSQDRRSDSSKNLQRETKGSQKKSCSPSSDKAAKGKKKIIAARSVTGTMTQFVPNAVNSPSCLSSPIEIGNAVAELSKESSSKTCQQMEQRTCKQALPSFSSMVRSCNLSAESKNVVSVTTEGDDNVFEDYFSPANHQKSKRPLLPNLTMEKDIQIPFELGSGPKKRKQRRSESLGFETSSQKKKKLEKSQTGENCDQQFDKSGEPQSPSQNDVKESWPALDNSSAKVKVAQRRRKNTLQLPSTSTTSIAVEQRETSASPTSTVLTETNTELRQNTVSVLSHTLESRGNECTVAAGSTKTSSEGEHHNKQVSLSLQKMVKRTKAMRTLVMTSMPTEKQHIVGQLVKTLGGFTIIDRVCESTTHVVSGSHRRTLNILLGIARGCWILSFDWILWCLEQRQWIPEEPYELSDQFPAAQICRLQRHLSAGEHQQDLFQSQPAMFVSQHSQPPTQSLVELIQLCGGTVCKTVRQAGICIGKYSGRRPKGSRILSEQWVLDSITHLKQLSYDTYDLE